MTDHRPPAELLESIHAFPGAYQIKAIGTSTNDFVGRVVAAVRAELDEPSHLSYSERFTTGRRHVAVTLDLMVQTAEQVRGIYERLREVEGLTMLL